MANTTGSLSRRRIITVLAAATAGPLLPWPVAAEAPRRWVWRGTALGAPATLILEHPDRAAAERAVAACVDEIERLEREFSLHRRDSAISRLNATGGLAPSLDMLALLEAAAAVSDASHGAFDITVQPLWELYARHFRVHPGGKAGPRDADVAAALRGVDYRQVSLTPEGIMLPGGMSITMNGIAQGYITDRVADLLRARGWTNVMIDLGEIYAIGSRADGREWTIEIDQPSILQDALPVLSVRDRAVATSSAAATVFEESGRYHHLLDPRTGRSACHCLQVTVVAGRAMLADALSTALFVARPEEREGIVRRFPEADCLVVDPGGALTRLAG